MALLNITLGTSPTPSGKPEYMLARVPLSFPFMSPSTDEMDSLTVLLELNQLAQGGWRVVTATKMQSYLLYTLFRIAP